MRNVINDIQRIAEAYANPLIEKETEDGSLISFEDYNEIRGFFEDNGGTLAPAMGFGEPATDADPAMGMGTPDAADSEEPAPSPDDEGGDRSENKAIQQLFDRRIKPVLVQVQNPASLEQFWGLMMSAILSHPKMNSTLRQELMRKTGEMSLAGVGLATGPAA